MLLARHDMRLIMFSIFTILILHSWGQNFSPKEDRLNGQRLREIKCEKFKHDYMSSDESYYNVRMGINDSDSAAGTYMKPCEALPMRAKMTTDKKKKSFGVI